jgi:hypothetical protein
MNTTALAPNAFSLKTPHGLSPRIGWLRDYYFQGTQRVWNNEFTCWSTGTPWDIQFNEMTYYIVPEIYTLLIIPLIQCQAADSRCLAFSPGAFASELRRIPRHTQVAVFCLTMKMEDVLIRGVFDG